MIYDWLVPVLLMFQGPYNVAVSNVRVSKSRSVHLFEETGVNIISKGVEGRCPQYGSFSRLFTH